MAEADTPDEKELIGTTSTDASEKEAEKQPGQQDRSPIFVDNSESATLRYSETSAVYPTLREARDAWLALPAEAKKGASITINKPDGARYDGWMIYRLWVLR